MATRMGVDPLMGPAPGGAAMNMGLFGDADRLKDRVNEEKKRRQARARQTGVEAPVGQASVYSILGVQ